MLPYSLLSPRWNLLDDSFRQSIEGRKHREVKADGAKYTVCPEATMDADLDTLCTVIYCTTDDLLPEAKEECAAWTVLGWQGTPQAFTKAGQIQVRGWRSYESCTRAKPSLETAAATQRARSGQ